MTVMKPWKLLHAELLRTIWWAGNQLLFDNKAIDHREIIAIIKNRALESIQIYHYAIRISKSKKRRQQVSRNICLWTETVPLCILDHTGMLKFIPELEDI
jgi:hypothetical protein